MGYFTKEGKQYQVIGQVARSDRDDPTDLKSLYVRNRAGQMISLDNLVTIEEASIGGLGAHVLTLASDEGLTDAGLKIRTMRLPDLFQDHDAPDKQYDEARLNAPHIVETVLSALRHNSAGVEEARA